MAGKRLDVKGFGDRTSGMGMGFGMGGMGGGAIAGSSMGGGGMGGMGGPGAKNTFNAPNTSNPGPPQEEWNVIDGRQLDGSKGIGHSVSLDLNLPMSGKEFRFMTPRGNAEITASCVSNQLVSRVFDFAISGVVLLAFAVGSRLLRTRPVSFQKSTPVNRMDEEVNNRQVDE